MKLKTIVVGLAAAVAIAGPASATDLFMAEQPYLAPAPAGFDWQGFYLGVYGGLESYPSPYTTIGEFGKVVGVNAVLGDSVLLGAEAQVEAWFMPGSGYAGWQGFLAGRAGLILGDQGRLLLYAIAGVGRPFPTGGGTVPNLWMAGGGAEWAVGDQLSVRGELAGRGCIDNSWVICATPTWLNAKGGVIWHL